VKELQIPRLPPDFLSSLVASANLMRLSLEKAAYVVVVESSVVGNPESARDDKGGSGAQLCSRQGDGESRRLSAISVQLEGFRRRAGSGSCCSKDLQIPRLPPDFLSSLVVSATLMRLSLEKAAYVVVDESSVVGNPESAPNEQKNKANRINIDFQRSLVS
jgi:hypothetical protein